MVDQTTGTIKLKAVSQCGAEALAYNFVNGRLIVDTRQDAVTVPSVAVRHGPRCDFAWIVRPDQTAATRCVTMGRTFADRTLIEGLAKGAPRSWWTARLYRLDEGSEVEITHPAAGRIGISH